MALPLTGLVSQLDPSLQGLLMHASLRWHSRPRQGSRDKCSLLFPTDWLILTQHPEINLCDSLKHPITSHNAWITESILSRYTWPLEPQLYLLFCFVLSCLIFWLVVLF